MISRRSIGCLMKRTGKVKFFDKKKGFGIIQLDGGGELFVHYTQVDGGILQKDELVECYQKSGPKGDFACEVKIVSN